MKIRNGFVSNSSTSSFIVAVNPECKGNILLTIEVDLNKYAESSISDIKSLNKHFKDNYGDDFMDDQNYEDARKAIENGKVVFAGSFSSEGEELEQLLCNYGITNLVDSKNKDIEVIEGEGDY